MAVCGMSVSNPRKLPLGQPLANSSACAKMFAVPALAQKTATAVSLVPVHLPRISLRREQRPVRKGASGTESRSRFHLLRQMQVTFDRLHQRLPFATDELRGGGAKCPAS